MDTFFLGSFLFGFLMVLASALLGFAHLALPGSEGLHTGHGGDGAHLGHGGDGVHVGHGSDTGGAHGADSGHAHGHGGHGWPIWNVSTLLAFLMWFGAAGYLATNVADLPLAAGIGAGVVAGAAGGMLVSTFLRFVMKGETRMNPADYRMEGTLARVTVNIPEGGTGEIIFTKGDRRRSEGARSAGGGAIARGEEVVVLEYQRGIAMVQPWQEFLSEARARDGDEPASRGLGATGS